MSILKKRAKRYGILRVFDELLFRGFYRLRYVKREGQLWSTIMPKQLRMVSTVDKPFYFCDDIHKDYWLKKIEQIEPHIIFGVCMHTIFKPKLFNIPKFGFFMLHEGITPEYRGLHTATWALLQREPEFIGYTLLKINEGIDSGAILCQGVYPDADKFGFCSGFIGHSALVYGLPEMKNALDKLYLNKGIFQEVSQKGRISKNYSWVSLSDYVRLKVFRKR